MTITLPEGSSGLTVYVTLGEVRALLSWSPEDRWRPSLIIAGRKHCALGPRCDSMADALGWAQLNAESAEQIIDAQEAKWDGVAS